MDRPYSTPHVGPLYPALPYGYRDVRKISAFCRCSAESLRKFLPPEFELVGDVCEIFTMEAGAGGPLGHYTEAGLVIPVKYGDITGAHVALEYVSTDDALAAGREIWGYPKKLADVPFGSDAAGTWSSTVTRRDTKLIDMSFTPETAEFQKPSMQPRLQVKTFAAADGNGCDYYQIVCNELQGLTVREQVPGRVELELSGNADDPLHLLDIKEIVGAELTLTDFLLSTGEILEDLNN